MPLKPLTSIATDVGVSGTVDTGLPSLDSFCASLQTTVGYAADDKEHNLFRPVDLKKAWTAKSLMRLYLTKDSRLCNSQLVQESTLTSLGIVDIRYRNEGSDRILTTLLCEIEPNGSTTNVKCGAERCGSP